MKASAAPPSAGESPEPVAEPPISYKKPVLSDTTKVIIAALLGVLIVFVTFLIIGKFGTNKRTEIYNRLVLLAAKDDVKEVPVNKEELQVLIDAAADVASNPQRDTIYKALTLAKATDNTNVDMTIAEFATKRDMAKDIRNVLIGPVLRKRKNPIVIPTLLAFCRSTDDVASAMAAIQTCRFMATDKELPNFLDIVISNSNAAIRKEAEGNVTEILKKSTTRDAFASTLATSLASATNSEVKYSLIRLIGCAGGPKATEVINKSLASSDKKEQLAAAMALGSWPDDSMFEAYMKFLDSVTDASLRVHVFDSGLRFLANVDGKRPSSASEKFWTLLAHSAKTREDQEKAIRALVTNESDAWALTLVKYFVTNSKDDNVIALAEKGVDYMESRAKRAGK